MLKNCMAGMSLIIVLTLTSLATAQDMPSGKWWKDPGIAKELNLSARDVRALDDLLVESRRRWTELKNHVEKEQFEYQTLIESKDLDESAVNRQLRRLEKARTELNSERSRFVLGIRKILGRDRFQRLQQIYR